VHGVMASFLVISYVSSLLGQVYVGINVSLLNDGLTCLEREKRTLRFLEKVCCSS